LELRKETDDFFRKNHAAFWEGFDDKEWNIFYEKNIRKPVSIKNNFALSFKKNPTNK
jgi:hypothetical protein